MKPIFNDIEEYITAQTNHHEVSILVKHRTVRVQLGSAWHTHIHNRLGRTVSTLSNNGRYIRGSITYRIFSVHLMEVLWKDKIVSKNSGKNLK